MPGKKIDQRSQLLQHRNECRSLGLMSTPKLKSETRALIVNRKQSAQLGFKNARDKPPKRPQLGSSSPLLATISTARVDQALQRTLFGLTSEFSD